MKRHDFWGALAVLGLFGPLAVLLLSYGGGSGSGASGTSDGSGSSGTSGTVSVAVTDAKPMLPEGTEHVYVTFDEVQVHKAGGDWVSLPVVAPAPHKIDLLQFSDGKTTQLVPPVKLTSGKYTQIRIIVSDAWLVTAQGEEYDLQVPSGKLRTDQNFDFEVEGGGAVDLVVDFDLSQSIVAQGNGKYKLKPVLHLVKALEAATIQGSIPADAFGSTSQATVTVWWDKDTSCSLDEGVDEVYTKVEVPKAEPAASFDIFWLVPNEAYIVEIDVGGNTFFFTVPGRSSPDGPCQTLPPSAVFDLGVTTIQGSIAAATFGSSAEARVTVLFDPGGDGLGDPFSDDKEYTEVTATKASDTTPTAFSVSVLPNQAYIVQVSVNGTLKYQEAIPASKLPAAGPPFQLNGGAAI
jgi:hypothetical protein